MDGIDSKLTSNNAVFVSHGVSKILEAISKDGKLVNFNGNMDQIPELKYLLSKCRNDNFIVSTTAFEALINLVEIGSLGTNTALSNFILMLGVVKNQTALTSAISSILIEDMKRHGNDGNYICPFTLKSCQHPLITILINHENMWREIIGQIQFIMNHSHSKISLHREEFLRPLFLHILCNPTLSNSESCRQHTWHLLINKNIEMNETKLEIVQWFRVVDPKICIDSNCRLLEFAEVIVTNRNKVWGCILMRLLANFALFLIKNGRDPRANLCMISDMAHIIGNNFFCDITLALLTEASCLCPVNYVHQLVKTCTTLLRTLRCTSIFAHALISSLLHWVTYPSVLLSNTVNDIRDLINSVSSRNSWPDHSQITDSREFSLLRHSQHDIQFYSELSETLNQKNVVSFLENLSNASKQVKKKCKLILSGLFLQTNDTLIMKLTCELLIEVAYEDKDFSCQFLSSILHNLTKMKDLGSQKILLFAMPELMGSQENSPVIIGVLKQLLAADEPLKFLAMELYFRAWKKDKKCHRDLVATLASTLREKNSWESNLCCAKIMKCMCETRPESCLDLVQMLSQILNTCNDVHGSGSSALALEGISHLCSHEVIDVESTWEVLAPKLNKDTRPMVLKSLCIFLGSIPSYISFLDNASQQFLVKIQTKLWDLVISPNLEIAEAAIQGLTSFNLENTSIEMLPSVLVDENAAPNVSWIRIIEYLDDQLVPRFGDLLRKHMITEIQPLPSLLYKQSQEPTNYKYLLENSVLRSLGEYLRRFKKTEDLKVVTECLRIFSFKFPKPLPPVKWSFLENFLFLSEDIKQYTIALICNQALVSLSAKNLLEKHLSDFYCKSEKPSFQPMDAVFFYNSLESVCENETLSPNVVKQFLQVTLEYTLSKALLNYEKSIRVFRSMMIGIGRALESSNIYEPSKMALNEVLENILDRVDVGSKLFSFAVSAVKMPNSKQEISKTPFYVKWKDFGEEKLRKLIIVETKFMVENTDMPLRMVHLINAVLSEPRLFKPMLESIHKIHAEMSLNQSSIAWILHLMNWIWMITNENKTESCTFLCDILMIGVISLSGMHFLLPNDELLYESKIVSTRLFPLAMREISESASKNDVQQIIEWLSHAEQRIWLEKSHREAFHNAIVALKYTKYFTENWALYAINKIR